MALWVWHSLVMQAFRHLPHLCHSPFRPLLSTLIFLVALTSILCLTFGHFCIALCHLRLSDSMFPLLFMSCPIHAVHFPIPTSHLRNCPVLSHPHKLPLWNTNPKLQSPEQFASTPLQYLPPYYFSLAVPFAAHYNGLSFVSRLQGRPSYHSDTVQLFHRWRSWNGYDTGSRQQETPFFCIMWLSTYS